ncbi:MAG: cobalamin biosynthesis protein CobW, partial [Lachnospiraceae bacterium]|nr:cobalamin biosynthesis protein CobW [Lachnospiraceae bacterium]
DDDDDDEHEHHHHHDDDDDDDDEHEHHHHHHDDDDDDDDDDEHEHHHHGHDHHHHHHADDIFDSWGYETPAKYSTEEIDRILDELDSEKYGAVLRAKGMVPDTEGGWIYFDYVPGEKNVRTGEPDVTGKFCVIGAELDVHGLEGLIKK